MKIQALFLTTRSGKQKRDPSKDWFAISVLTEEATRPTLLFVTEELFKACDDLLPKTDITIVGELDPYFNFRVTNIEA
jgi:hypothetical protein